MGNQHSEVLETSLAKLSTFLQQIEPIPDDVLAQYLDLWSIYEVPKQTIMTAPGETERYMYFVLEGVQKSYYQHHDKQHIIAFTYTPSFSGIPESFLTQTPARYFLETLSASSFLRIPYERHVAFMEAHREIETLIRKATEFFLIGLMERHYELMALTIQERFQVFTKRSPHLLQLVSHKDLASYLRIDPSNFSKLYNSVKI